MKRTSILTHEFEEVHGRKPNSDECGLWHFEYQGKYKSISGSYKSAVSWIRRQVRQYTEPGVIVDISVIDRI